MKQTFIIGDVHGCYYTLLALIKKLPKKAKLIFLGDLCDKGNFSKEVIEFVIENGHQCVKGNHEYMMHNFINNALYEDDISSKWATKKGWGGQKTIDSYRKNPQMLKKHLSWIEELPLFIEIDKYFITHGFGLPYYKRKHLKDSHALFVNRVYDATFMQDWEDFRTYKIINIFGHCNFDEVLRGKQFICIDTGCCYGNKLTALNLDTLKITSQKTDKRDIS
ncbi:MAG: metallophosphoesterase family protein [Sulfurospirillaceae bacterium]|nr:metallophosphoesterase family protein [Sulfurospirillaceae bacterium]